MPSYENDVLKDIADAKRGAKDAQAKASKRAPISKFSAVVTFGGGGNFDAPATLSAGAVLPAQSEPATPATGVVAFADGNEPAWKDADGNVVKIPPPMAPAAAVANPPLFNSPSAPASVTVAVYQDLRDDCQSGIRNTLIQLMNSLRAAGYLES
jgi:hypothetical protein